jgi:hypothetical protein
MSSVRTDVIKTEAIRSYATKADAANTFATNTCAAGTRAADTRAITPGDKRRSRRRSVNRPAKIKFDNRTPPHECVITDISTGGVRLRVVGFEVPDEFVLLDSRDGNAAEFCYRVVWRQGEEVGARFVGRVTRRGGTSRD